MDQIAFSGITTKQSIPTQDALYLQIYPPTTMIMGYSSYTLLRYIDTSSPLYEAVSEVEIEMLRHLNLSNNGE